MEISRIIRLILALLGPLRARMSFVPLCFCILYGYGQTSRVDEFMEMTLEELLSVSIVSEKQEFSLYSPGVVTSYDAQQLKALGLKSLKDFLHFVPGLEVNESLTARTLLQLRGMPATSNQKILFMLNGVPYWMPANGDLPLTGIPFGAIKKIEVIRGPGSVLYGTNASSGVINVITKDENGFTAEMNIGQDDLYNLSFWGGGKMGNDGWWNLAYEGQTEDGYMYGVENAFAVDPCFCFPETENGELLRRQEMQSVLARLNWQGFEGSIHAFKGESRGDVNGSILSPTIFKDYGTQVALSYNKTFSKVDLKVFSDWNRFYRDSIAEDLLVFFYLPGDGAIEFENNGSGNTRWRSGIRIQAALNPNWKWKNGLDYEDRGTDGQKFRDDTNGATLALITQPPYNLPFQFQDDGSILLIEPASATERSAFSQLDYQNGSWRATLGGRYIDNNTSGHDLSPRGSLVYAWTNSRSLKLLYAEGFNSPTFSQSAATDLLGVPQNIQIKAETIKTWDFAYTQVTEKFSHVANLFYTEGYDLIESTQNRTDVLHRMGAEYDMRFQHEGWRILSGISLVAEGNDEDEGNEARFVSRWLSKFGMNYRFRQHQFGASLRSGGARAGVDTYNLLNVRYQVALSPKWVGSVTVYNLLNDEVWQPDTRNYSTLILASQKGFNATLAFQFKFSPNIK